MNPFYLNPKHHFYLVYESLGAKNAKVLDIGFGDGEFIQHLDKKIKSVYGYDVNKKSALEFQKKNPSVNIKFGKVGSKLPYKDAFFDAVFLLHVLEHVDDEDVITQEIYRVIKNKGALYLASPYKGLFAWADMANLRYNFPLIHKLFGKIFYGKEKFAELFEGQKRSLFGDSSRQRNSHYHYKEEEIKKLLAGRFKIEKFYKYSLLQPFLFSIWNILFLLFGKVPYLLKKIVWWDNKLKMGELAYNFFVVAKKI